MLTRCALAAAAQAVARNAVALGQPVALDEMALSWEVCWGRMWCDVMMWCGVM